MATFAQARSGELMNAKMLIMFEIVKGLESSASVSICTEVY